ncbi:MAG: FAD-dependent oxidoreductase [Candidatus Kerfeldbacteria bacterium]|nr:FAD-dependent oxidoreductase [Candidatus Kerfeldbacteria bacterium]
MPTPVSTSPWFAFPPDQPRYPVLKKELSADVVILGGGIVGVMTAWELAKHGMSVVVVEKNVIASGDTGLTTAFLSRVPDTSLPAIAKRYGQGMVNALLSATSSAQESLFNTIEQEQIDCDFDRCRSYTYSYEAGDKRMDDLWAVIQQADKRTQRVNATHAEATGAPIADAVCMENEGRFHIRKFLFGLLERPQAKKIHIFEETEATAVTVNEHGVIVTTPHGAVRAKKLIVTTGLPHDAFAELRPLFTHVLTYVMSVQFEKKVPISDDLFWDIHHPYFYYRRLDDHTMILGGADTEVATMDPTQKPFAELSRFVTKYFPEKSHVTHTWSGSLFLTEDELPYISEHPHYADRVYVASGFSGNGMVMGAMAGTILADLVRHVANPYATLFSFTRTGIHIPKPQPYPSASSQQHSRQKTPLVLKRFFQILIPLFYIAILILPGYLFFTSRGGLSFLNGLEPPIVLLLIFPLVGLYAFTILWAQFMMGTNMPYLRRLFPWILRAHITQGIFVLLFALAHPLLLINGIGFTSYVHYEFVGKKLIPYAVLGQISVFILMLTIATGLLRKSKWLQNKWWYIHLLNYALFVFTWIHSWNIGSDTQIGNMKYLWLFFGTTGVLSILVRIGRALRKRFPKTVSSEKHETFTRVASIGDVVEGKPLCVSFNGRKVALFHVGDYYYAIDNTCTHAGGPICEGKMEGTTVQCPWHGAKFNVTTGEVVGPPAKMPLKKYHVRVRGNDIVVRL